MAYRKRPRFCTICGADAEDGAQISWRSLCVDCGIQRAETVARAMSSKDGPEYERSRAAHVEYMRKAVAEWDAAHG